MFSREHLIWLGICAVIIAVTLLLLNKFKPPLKRVLDVACVLCVISELVVVATLIKVVPSSGGVETFMYLPLSSLPLHLCSIQTLFVFMARAMKDEERRQTLLAFMYVTCLAGAGVALVVTSLFNSVDTSEAFTHPRAYQYHLFHCLLVILGAYIAMCGEVRFRKKHILSTLKIVALLGWASVYINSICSHPIYDDEKLQSIEYGTNYFFTFQTPIGIEMTEKWHWFLYLFILFCIIVAVELICYLPLIKRDKKYLETK